ncbi:PASTA domain-containing protein [Mycetocola miduiensis]|uniref:PASTA domain, binds beta-lactams n=1 Tax=Mycetocola miduiensis TaxID=995034 RepID=A0A1I4ZK30_9MICO|nr:PASTA domain-containing protein [Mycetocola miduiensis]SFN50300.1 PASTA domain, binds beta-lactams [Mycetocola miduiensis]
MARWISSSVQMLAILAMFALGFTALGLDMPAAAVQAPARALDIRPMEGEPGTEVTAVATGFEDCPLGGSDDVGNPNVTFLWEEEGSLRDVGTAPFSSGRAEVPFTVPSAASAGTHRVVARCSSDAGMAAANTFLVTSPAAPALDVDPTEGEPGTEVTAVATGFQDCLFVGSDDVGNPNVTFLWEEEGSLRDVGTAPFSSGRAEVFFTVPSAASAGTHRVVARCSSDAGMEAANTFLVTSPLVTVPELIGLSSEQAAALLEDSALVLGRVSGSGEDVVDQNPLPGTVVRVESSVDITFGVIAPELVAVPNVVGLTRIAAQDAIAGAGLSVGVVSGSGELVGEQSLVPGADVPRGTSVDLALQVLPPQMVVVPDLIGMSLEDALTELGRLGLQPVVSGASEGDTIEAQNPAPGTLVTAGSGVTIVASARTSVGGVVLGMCVLVLVLVLVAARTILRRRRHIAERVWAAEHVRADLVSPVASTSSIAEAPTGNEPPRHVARIEPHPDEPHYHVEEVRR